MLAVTGLKEEVGSVVLASSREKTLNSQSSSHVAVNILVFHMIS